VASSKLDVVRTIKVLNLATHLEEYGTGGMAARILELSTRYKGKICFTVALLYTG
jgi:hypothetical protein